MIKLLDKPNVITTDLDHPLGKIKQTSDGSPATPINRLVMNDMFTFLEKLMVDSGVTPNGLLDNVTNGYQLSEALDKLTGRLAWTAGATPVATCNNAPTGSVTINDPGDIIYNKYRKVGKTLWWQLNLDNVTIAGSPTEIYITNPVAVPSNFANPSMKLTGLYNGDTPILIELNGPSSAGQISISLLAGGAFTNGTNDQSFDINIVGEIV